MLKPITPKSRGLSLGGPADLSDDLHAEDKIIGVAQGEDGEMVDVIGWRLDDVVDLIRGPRTAWSDWKYCPRVSARRVPARRLSLSATKSSLNNRQPSQESLNWIIPNHG
ncbi:MAG: PDZ domain-containing protein [Gammaproteobacteria bacterium]|nr:PDZ domain-containing protein [Gammaproteobacteria bacterium]